ncbi:MAG: Glyoxylate reductase [Candidatus Collierbacteria bacterium GW2011_GWB2_44_22]|uniref:Glyoxylate reductase n=1 Tax=Candidatus Collierbacteria bacterium GW2011_GWB2_44_22 TaxID=1618387 RepID=A0A0G1HWE1_9BACT|nr:MAG: Glyoxylate reductase [Candidatus Collierbacteria bacterium GW2011_GWB2_44_22]
MKRRFEFFFAVRSPPKTVLDLRPPSTSADPLPACRQAGVRHFACPSARHGEKYDPVWLNGGMEKLKIFVTHVFLGKFVERLKDRYEVVVWPGRDIGREDLLKGVRGSTGIISLLTEKIDEEVMKSAGVQLKVISNYAVGYDNIDVSTATKRGICVTNTPGVLTESVAEEVLALTLSLFRRIVEGDRLIRSGKYKGWEPDLLLGTGIKDKVMGIVGLGRIGRWTARMCSALGMKIIYFNRHRDEEFEEEYSVTYHTFDQLLEKSDVVSLSVPLTKETQHMVGERELKLMKPTALLINTARGPIVDQEMLIRALREKWIAGAGLDVFEDETNVPQELRDLPNTILTPHTASATN